MELALTELTWGTLVADRPRDAVHVAPARRPDRTGTARSDRGGTKVEQWGLCVSCDRWFYCGTNPEVTEGCRCPACDRAPVAIRESWDA